jgi:hypothetical protein
MGLQQKWAEGTATAGPDSSYRSYWVRLLTVVLAKQPDLSQGDPRQRKEEEGASYLRDLGGGATPSNTGGSERCGLRRNSRRGRLLRSAGSEESSGRVGSGTSNGRRI